MRETTAVWTRISTELHNQLAELAGRHGRTLAGEVRRALRFYIANWDQVNQILVEHSRLVDGEWVCDPHVELATVIDDRTLIEAPR